MSDHDLAAAVAAELAWLHAIACAEDRAYAATQAVDVLQRAVVDVAGVRAAAWMHLRAEGWTLQAIAHRFGVSRARVAQVTGNGGLSLDPPPSANPRNLTGSTALRCDEPGR